MREEEDTIFENPTISVNIIIRFSILEIIAKSRQADKDEYSTAQLRGCVCLTQLCWAKRCCYSRAEQMLYLIVNFY